jgi:hypothetical protein
MSGIDQQKWELEMNKSHRYRLGLARNRHVITLCDYGTCPTIKSNNAINAIIVVKSDGKLQPIETGTNDRDNNHYEPLENRTLGALL